MIIKKSLLFLFLLCAWGCSRPHVIPDDELAEIFRDAFLSNAYISKTYMSTDSLRVYAPIFARHGYTTQDVEHTIGNFSKRKSARLSDVVEQAIVLLDEQGAYYDREVAILDTIDHASRRAFTRVVYTDSLIRVSRLQDTSRLRIELKKVYVGEYNISFNYLIDSLDQNKDLRGGVWLDQDTLIRRDIRNLYLTKYRDEQVSRMLTADSADCLLVLNLWSPSGKRKRPSITIRDLQIRYTPPTSVAIDSLYLQQMNIGIFAKEFFGHAMQKDSL